MSHNDYSRRDFLKTSILGGAAITFSYPAKAIFADPDLENRGTQVSISTGVDRADMAFRALKPFSRQIRQAIGNRRVVLGSGFYGINYNIAMLAQRLHPALAVIDGYEGMEGNGPTLGTAIDHKVCVVSQDWLSADRVGVELMGIDFSKIGYLNHCTQMGLGNSDLNKIEIVGENLKDHIKPYKLPSNFDKLISWMNPKI